jgi:uncharacterized membrane protein YsdA (DUF1294 family)
MNPSGTKFSRDKIVLAFGSPGQGVSDKIFKKKVNRKDFNILSLLKIWQQRQFIVAKLDAP